VLFGSMRLCTKSLTASRVSLYALTPWQCRLLLSEQLAPSRAALLSGLPAVGLPPLSFESPSADRCLAGGSGPSTSCCFPRGAFDFLEQFP